MHHCWRSRAARKYRPQRRFADPHEVAVGPAEELDRQAAIAPRIASSGLLARDDDRCVPKLDDARCSGARLVHDGDVTRRQVAAIGGGTEEPAERVPEPAEVRESRVGAGSRPEPVALQPSQRASALRREAVAILAGADDDDLGEVEGQPLPNQLYESVTAR